MKDFSALRPVRLLAIALAGALYIASLTPLIQAQSSSGQRDCDANAVLRCGAYTTAEVNQKYDSQAGATTIFHYFGISSTELSRMHDTAKSGYVTKGGRVLLDGKPVATDAITAGRQDMPGSQPVTRNNTTFYTRPTSASFTQNKLDAYVVMSGGQFQYAVIKSCGNPVTATPVAEPQPEPTPEPQPVSPPAPAPPAPTSTPPPLTPVQSSAECRMLNVSTGQNRQVNVAVDSVASNAQVIGYSIDFGDGFVTNGATINGTNSGGVTSANAGTTNGTVSPPAGNNIPAIAHQYAQDGTYTITASVQVRYPDGRTETLTSENCKKAVTFNTPVTPAASPPPPQQPQTLPATGNATGDAAIAITMAMIVSGIGYTAAQMVWRRFGLVK